MSIYAILLAAALGSAPQIQVQPLGGQPLSGQLLQLDGRQLTLGTPDGPRQLDMDKLAGISHAVEAAVSRQQPDVWIELVDGSTIAAATYTVRNGQARLTFPGGEEIRIPVRAVANVRFQERSPAADLEWSRIVGLKIQADLLLSSKDEVLDYHKGAIRDVTDKAVDFDLEGEAVAVKRSKIYGLIYYHADEGPQPEASAAVTDSGGSRWSARVLSFSGKWQWTTPCGVTVTRAPEQVAQVDLSLGKIVYLSDLKAEAVHYTPFFALEKESPLRLEFFRPRYDQNFEAKTLRIDGRQFRKGLSVHSRTELIYTLPGRFSRLEATAGIDDDVRPRGAVRLVIQGNDKVLLETTLSGNDPPRPLQVDLTGVRRLTILADFARDLDIGGLLDLGDARIIK
ncbi:MAG: NPCBM/NEW2 domain-containing protein [Thermoguttaceae bacterium]